MSTCPHRLTADPETPECRPKCSSPRRAYRRGLLRVQSSATSAGQDLIEDGFRLVLVGLLGQPQLGDEELASLRQQAPLPGRPAPDTPPEPTVADNPGHLHTTPPAHPPTVPH